MVRSWLTRYPSRAALLRTQVGGRDSLHWLPRCGSVWAHFATCGKRMHLSEFRGSMWARSIYASCRPKRGRDAVDPLCHAPHEADQFGAVVAADAGFAQGREVL